VKKGNGLELDASVFVVAEMVAALDGKILPSEAVALRPYEVNPTPRFLAMIADMHPIERLLTMTDSGRMKESEIIRAFVEMAMKILGRWKGRRDARALRCAFALWTAVAVAAGKLCSIEMRALDALRCRLGLADEWFSDIRSLEGFRDGERTADAFSDEEAMIAAACENMSRSKIGQMAVENEKYEAVVLTAYRQSRDPQINKRLHMALGERLRNDGFVTYPVVGAYHEEESDQTAQEESWFVANAVGVSDFLMRMASICETAEQDSMLVIPRGRFKTGQGCYLYGTNPTGTNPRYHERTEFGVVFFRCDRWVFLPSDLV